MFLRYLALILIMIFSCGAGYNGELPRLVVPPDTNQPPQEKKEVPAPITPLAPRNFPAIEGGAIIRQNKYTKYQKDLDLLIVKLESIKKTMQDKDSDIQMQMFCAKANLVDLYIQYIKDKYAKKPERYYESYKIMLDLDKNIVDAANYWKTTRQYMRMIYKTASERNKEEVIFNKKFDKSLKSVDTLLEILKENMQKGSF